MAFKIACRGGRFGMRAFCDHCGNEVFNDECNVLSARDINEGGSASVVIACKEECTGMIDPYRQMANQELGQCVLHLVTNAKIDIAEERDWARQMHENFGLVF